VPILLVGRGIQAIGGNAAWIVGLATLVDTVGQDNTGKTLGAISSFFVSGLLFGPMTSGMLLPLVGYWITWMVAISVLVVDMIMRVIMIQNKQSREVNDIKNTLTVEVPSDIEAMQANNPNEVNEQTALLHVSSSENEDQNYSKPQSDMATNFKPNSVPELSTSSENFYKFILTNSRALTALICHWTTAVILLSLDTTLPLHATRTLGWNTAGVSLMFLILQMPSLLLATFLGMLKDRVGTKIPTGFGFLAMAFSLWLLGAAANGSLVFASIENKAQTITMVALAGIGIARTFISGSGIMEITSKS
jgi:MFS family permease